ncbi:hypothetical protein ANN_19577 [Periplaneta americana]|uniref:Uncharacterized protein n=1 Tax=Periplaneta americana TaxID=6978 RepID=A0ABQ8SAU6_PERAM|nr:hypothetical protein ANN_19577 [Periplaneta americana]
MSPRSSTESYPASARIGLRENPGKNLNRVTFPDRDSNPGHLVSRPDALTVTPQCNHQLRMDVYAVFHQCAGDVETHRLEDADKVEQKLLLYMWRALLPFPRASPLPCRLTREKCRHPFSIDDYTELKGKEKFFSGQHALFRDIRYRFVMENWRKHSLSTEITNYFQLSTFRHNWHGSRAVASWSKASRLGLALRNARWFESSWGKKFSHEISASVWDRCPPSIVMHLGSYDRCGRTSCENENGGVTTPENIDKVNDLVLQVRRVVIRNTVEKNRLLIP